jgi:hypothetical protein
MQAGAYIDVHCYHVDIVAKWTHISYNLFIFSFPLFCPNFDPFEGSARDLTPGRLLSWVSPTLSVIVFFLYNSNDEVYC